MGKAVGVPSSIFSRCPASIVNLERLIDQVDTMHILLTNDDGPPSEQASPYVATLVEVLKAAGHVVSVVLPSTQRSWIGKAHLLPPSFYALPGQRFEDPNERLSEACTPTYYDPISKTVHDRPPSRSDYWVLVPGTPATCSQLGLFHYAALFPERPATPVDLVVSGPNFGRNTSAAFALSSGTIGGALEAAVCGVRGIALSFAFFTRQEGAALVQEACEHSVKIISRLCQDWHQSQQARGSRLSDGSIDPKAIETPDLYSINVPLKEGVSKQPIHWTWMLDNKWPGGSLYQALQTDHQDGEAVPSFKWAPSFTDLWKIVDASPVGNDGLTVRNGETSITPLRANFNELFGKAHFTGEFKL